MKNMESEEVILRNSLFFFFPAPINTAFFCTQSKHLQWTAPLHFKQYILIICSQFYQHISVLLIEIP